MIAFARQFVKQVLGIQHRHAKRIAFADLDVQCVVTGPGLLDRTLLRFAPTDLTTTGSIMDRIGNRQLLGAAMARRAFLFARFAGRWRRLLGIRLRRCRFLRGLGTVLFELGILRTPLGARYFVQLFFPPPGPPLRRPRRLRRSRY
jgi:hypothetical protein